MTAAQKLSFEDLLEQVTRGSEERERDDENPFEAVDLVRRARLGALRVPQSEGGEGGSLRDLYTTVIRLAEADPQVAHILRSHYIFVEEALRGATEQNRARWVGEIAGGALFGNATAELTRHDAGSQRLETVLTPENGHHRLNGTKFFTTGTLFADHVAVAAAQPDGGLVRAVVPVDREGVTVEDDWDGFGQRRTGSGTTSFENVHVAEDELLGLADPVEGRQWRASLPQLYLQAVMTGILRNVVTDAVAVVHRRSRTFEHGAAATAADDPQLQQVIGTLSANANAAEAIVLAAADAQDRAAAHVQGGAVDPELDHEASVRAAQAKVVVDDLALRSTAELFEVGGASATRRSWNLDRHWRNVRTLSSHNPTVYKARSLGALAVHGDPLPINGYY